MEDVEQAAAGSDHESSDALAIGENEQGYRWAALQEQAMWDALGMLGDEISGDADRAELEAERTRSRIEQVALALSTGVLALIARASSLTAMALSSLPIWQRVDPLSVLALSERERKKREMELREAEDEEDESGHLGELFDSEPDPEPDPDDDLNDDPLADLADEDKLDEKV